MFFDGQLSHPQPKPDLPDRLPRRMDHTAPANAAATRNSTRIVPSSSRKNCIMAHTRAAPALRLEEVPDGFAAGRNSRYSIPASTAAAATVNRLNATSPAISPPS